MTTSTVFPQLVDRHVFRSQMPLDCPHCGSEVERYIVGTRSTIGEPVAACPACGGPYLTLRSEWGHKRLSKRVLYLLKLGWGGLYFGHEVTALVFLAAVLCDREDLVFDGFGPTRHAAAGSGDRRVAPDPRCARDPHFPDADKQLTSTRLGHRPPPTPQGGGRFVGGVWNWRFGW